jgi:AraC family transcriptional regulator
MHARDTMPAMMRAKVRQPDHARAVDFSSLRPESVQLSSRTLGWKLLNFERREVGPSRRDLPDGATEHLVFVSLSSGTLTCESTDRTVRHEFAPGFVAVVPSGSPVHWRWDARISFSLLALEPAFLRQVGEESLGLDAEQVRLVRTEREQDPAISTIAAALAREAVRGDAGSRVYAESLATILAVHLLRNYLDAPPDAAAVPPAQVPRAIGRAVAFIQQNHASDISLGDIAASVHMSPFHLARTFKKVMGVSPYQYLLQMRVNSARSLIMAGGGEHSLAEIATSVGFADQSHLTRHFKRVLGVTPRQLVH